MKGELYVSTVDKIIYTMTTLIAVMLIGMFLSSWRLIIYPYTFVIGLTLCLGMIRTITRNNFYLLIPTSISLIYLLLYGILDVITTSDPLGGTSYIVGMAPSMAVFLLGIWPMSIVVCLLYAWHITKEKSIE